MTRIIKYKEDYISEFIQKVMKGVPNGVVLTHLPPELIWNLSVGNTQGNAEKEVFEALLRQETVWTAEETLGELPTGEMGKTLRKSLKKLLEIGICVVPLTKLPFWVCYGARAERLLTAERAEIFWAQGFRGIYLPPESKITPLARGVLEGRKMALIEGRIEGERR